MLCSMVLFLLSLEPLGGEGRLLVADSKEGALLVVAEHDLSVRRTIAVGPGARSVAVSAAGDLAAVTRSIYNRVVLVDCGSWKTVAETPLAAEEDLKPIDRRYYPVGVVFWGDRWWVACGWRDCLVGLERESGEVASRLELRVGERGPVWPGLLARGPEGALLVTTFRAGRVGRLESGGRETIWSEKIVRSPWGLAVLEDGRLVVASLDDNKVAVLNAASLEVEALLDVPGGPILVAASGDPRRVILALHESQEVVGLDLETGKASARVELDGPPTGLAVAPLAAFVTVASMGTLWRVALPELASPQSISLQGAPEGVVYQDARPPEALAGD
ncbi:MAG: hypothetical protein AB1486_31285 [Planctomycetota bacterium]